MFVWRDEGMWRPASRIFARVCVSKTSYRLSTRRYQLLIFVKQLLFNIYRSRVRSVLMTCVKWGEGGCLFQCQSCTKHVVFWFLATFECWKCCFITIFCSHFTNVSFLFPLYSQVSHRTWVELCVRQQIRRDIFIILRVQRMKTSIFSLFMPFI